MRADLSTLDAMSFSRGVPASRSPFWNLALVVLAATPFSGCNPPRPPDTVVEPTIIGVVDDISRASGGFIRLEDGTEITWDEIAFEIGGRSGSEGDLFIYGTEPIEGGDAPWMIILAPSTSTVGEGSDARPACYFLQANGEVRGDRLAFSTGFSLPLVDPTDDQWQQGEFIEYPMRDFCLDEVGRVLSWR